MRVTFKAAQFLGEGQSDEITLTTYLSAALVAYARPFSDGVRGSRSLKLEAGEVYKHIEGADALHKYLIDQRNKLVAHSVNPFEDVSVGIILNNVGRPAGVGYLASRLVSFTVEDWSRFNQLCKTALEWVNEKSTLLQKQLLTETTAYSDQELSKLKIVRYTAPHPNQAQRPRA